MGLAKSRGSLDPKQQCFMTPESEVPQVEMTSLSVSPGTVLDNQPYVSDTVGGQNTITVGNQSDELTSAITAYIEGPKVTVTWFHSLTSEDYKHTAQTDWSPTQNSVHYSFKKINNFKFALKGNFSFEYEQATAKSTLTGEGVLYPYFCPNTADMFVYPVQDGIWGLYKLSEAPIRLSIKTNTCHSIKFVLLRYLTDAEYSKLLECVEDEVYFDLDNYLNTEGGFITSNELNATNDANKLINTLINYYNTEFYDSDVYRSFIDNHCLYDPYLIEFWTKIVPISKSYYLPEQLVPNPKLWKRSFWFRLLHPDILPNELVVYKAFRVLKRITYRTVNINALSNHCFVALSKDGKHPYPPFRIPEVFDETKQTLQMELRLYLDQGKVRPPVLMSVANNIFKCSRPAQFYFIPILIFLLKRLVDALGKGENIVLGDLDDSATCTNDCANCLLDCNTCGHKPSCPPVDPRPQSDYTGGCHCTSSCKYLIQQDGSFDPSEDFDEPDIHDGCEEYIKPE